MTSIIRWFARTRFADSLFQPTLRLADRGIAQYRALDPHEPLRRDAVATAVLFLMHGPVRRLRSVRRREPAYVWKHRGEAWAAALGFEPYISTSEFLAGCYALDVPVRVLPTGDALVGLSHAGPA
jgi:hypothetical protein